MTSGDPNNPAPQATTPSATTISPSPLISLPSTKTFPINRQEGIKFDKKVENANFSHIKFKHIAGGNTDFHSCNFSFCEFEDASFRKATFTNCLFVSVKCSRSTFRDATFNRCDFEYAQFFETIIDEKELITNAPTQRPNVRREFMMALRKNAESMGDTTAIRHIIKEELLAERQFHSEAWKQKTRWYRDKYPRFFDRLGHWFKSLWLTIDWLFWGHGEHPLQFIKSMAALVVFFGMLVFIFGTGIDLSLTAAKLFTQMWRAFVVAAYIFLDVPVSFQEYVPPLLSVIIVIFRYVELGLFTSMIFRLLSHR